MGTITYETKNYIFKTINNIDFYMFTKSTKQYIKVDKKTISNILENNIYNFNI